MYNVLHNHHHLPVSWQSSTFYLTAFMWLVRPLAWLAGDCWRVYGPLPEQSDLQQSQSIRQWLTAAVAEGYSPAQVNVQLPHALSITYLVTVMNLLGESRGRSKYTTFRRHLHLVTATSCIYYAAQLETPTTLPTPERRRKVKRWICLLKYCAHFSDCSGWTCHSQVIQL